ncbi:hypothetical protein HHI36_000081 [Cryptolaemus montrouzieri]|uniref:Uncharacterized protein n=1 Tax=Cryptolaemus montrouzieri TaxID=559131 RepID=A0ABD2P4D0_9CUCU
MVIQRTRSPFSSITYKTEELSRWINKVKRKKSTYAHQKRRNFLVFALLSSSLQKLQCDLKETQEIRKKRWQAFNKPLPEPRKKPVPIMEVEESEPITNWDPVICEELDRSISEFMSKLKEIKTPLIR